jgi:ABC-type molybdenum transport system ATPase subunit/photorepair protein PhrA
VKAAGSLTLRGWKGFEGNSPLPLWPVTILVGPNGSGKSSLLEALGLLSHLARRGTLGEDLRPWLRGWPDGVLSRSGPSRQDEEAAIELRWGRSEYRLVLRDPVRPQIWEESLKVAGRIYIQTTTRGGRRQRSFRADGAGRPLETRSAEESALGLISRSPRRRERAQRVIDLMTAIEVYSLDADFLRGTAVDTRPIPYARKGTSLVSGLIDAARKPEIWDAVLSAIRAVQPDLETITTSTRPRGAVLRYVDGRETQLDEESDGLVRAAGMFLVRYRWDCPDILGFDEPENGFHLSRLVDVVERLAPSEARDGVPTPQLVLLATHSPELVYKAARTLGYRMGVLALWRSKDGRVTVNPWPGEEIAEQGNFDLLRAEGFEGR